MDKKKLFSDVISKLFNLDVYFFDSRNGALEYISQFYGDEFASGEKVSEIIERKLSGSGENTLLSYCDNVYASVVTFPLDDEYVVLQPFAITEWEDKERYKLFQNAKLPEEYFSAYKLIYVSLPVVDRERLVYVVGSLSESVNGIYLNVVTEEAKKEDYSERLRSVDVKNFSAIESRYLLERKFLDAIKEGNSKKAIADFEAMIMLSGGLNVPFVREKDVATGLAIIRTLCIVAAYEGGASAIAIEELSRKYANSSNKYEGEKAFTAKCIEMIKRYCEKVSESRANSDSPVIRMVKEYIELNFASKIALSDIAKECRISEGYLSHVFKKEVGISVRNYLENYRMEKAAAMLKTTGIPIQEIGETVGYEDNNYFSKIFGKHFKVSPSKYRKNG